MKRLTQLFKLLLAVAIMSSANLYAQLSVGDDPIPLGSAVDLVDLSNTDSLWGRDFILTADIDLAGATITPIGNSTISFTGVFDGDGKIISNFTVNEVVANDGTGLIGNAKGATVKNLGIEDFTCTAVGERAGVVGIADLSTTVDACYSSGNTTIQAKYRSGGIVGWSKGESSVTNCWSNATVVEEHSNTTATWPGCGGIVGSDDATTSNCLFFGTLSSGTGGAGKRAGISNGAAITNSYFLSTVDVNDVKFGATAKTDAELKLETSYVGFDFTNVWVMDPDAPNYATLQKFTTVVVQKPSVSITSPADGASYSIGDDITVNATVTSNGDSNSPIAGAMVNIGAGDVAMTLVSGNDYTYTFTTSTSPYTINVTGTDQAGEFSSTAVSISAEPTYSGGSGTVADPYEIADSTDLMALSGWSDHWGAIFIQTADIDMTNRDFRNIGHNDNKFTGSYDGQNHTISNLSISAVQDGQGITGGGLFGTTSGANISNLGLVDPSINLSTQERVGGIVGELLGGSLSNCFVKGGTVQSGKGRVGGVVGYTPSAQISNVYATCTVIDVWNNKGGVIGQMGWNAAWASGSSLTNAFFNGTTTGNGILGTAYSLGTVPVSITNAYYIEGAGAADDSATLVAVADSKLEATYVGFDFDNNWGLSAVDSLPILRGFPMNDVQIAKYNLTIAGDLDNVADDLTLVANQDGTTVTWASSNSSVISDGGELAENVGVDTEVDMTATITSGSESTTKVFSITVKAGVYTDLAKHESATLTLYPNPTSSMLNLSEEVSLATIYNLNGALVKSVSHTNAIDVAELTAGMYFLRADKEIIKFVKE